MRANQIQASVPAPVASLPPREPMPSVHFSMARTVHFSMAIDTPGALGRPDRPQSEQSLRDQGVHAGRERWPGSCAGATCRVHRPRTTSRPTSRKRLPGIRRIWLRARSNSIRQKKREQYRSVRVAEVLPAFTSVIVDRLNHLWVEEYEAPGEERPGLLWTVFDPDGRVLGFVAMPERLEVFEIGEDYILGLWRDDLRVEYVQVWPLERL